MAAKKIFGYIFMVIALILSLAIVGQLPQVIGIIASIFKIFSGQLDSYQVGEVTGIFIYWLLHISLTVFLWIVGRRWTKSKTKNDE